MAAMPTAQWLQCETCAALVPDVSMPAHMEWHEAMLSAATHDLPGMFIRRQRVATPALILGGKTTLTVTWSEPMPSDAYKVALALDPALVGKVTATVASQTAARITVAVSAGLAVASGVLDATAYTLVHEPEA